MSSCLQPVKLFWSQIPMATAIFNKKKATKTARTDNEILLRTRTIQRAAILLKQVSDPTRLRVVTLLSEKELHVGGLCEQFNMSQPAVSHHLALLRHGGIVNSRRQGKNSFYSLTDTGYRLSRIVKGVVR
jgi:DNA-binding transcriptional ArsR family regulator